MKIAFRTDGTETVLEAGTVPTALPCSALSPTCLPNLSPVRPTTSARYVSASIVAQ
jgi:hypothetical protein